mgnify:CR=1 FL=1
MNLDFKNRSGGKTYFELWRTDGSPDGTFPLLSLRAWNPRGQNSFKSNPNDFYKGWEAAVIGEKMYFLQGREVWETDGTIEGTKEVQIPLNDTDNSFIAAMKIVGNTIFFLAPYQDMGLQLYRFAP